jgi:hypothetical protein
MSTIVPVKRVPDGSKLPEGEAGELYDAFKAWKRYRAHAWDQRNWFIRLVIGLHDEGYSDQAIADALGLSRGYIQRLRSGGK